VLRFALPKLLGGQKPPETARCLWQKPAVERNRLPRGDQTNQDNARRGQVLEMLEAKSLNPDSLRLHFLPLRLNFIEISLNITTSTA
jgi:hypothetical protein